MAKFMIEVDVPNIELTGMIKARHATEKEVFNAVQSSLDKCMLFVKVTVLEVNKVDEI